MNRQRKTRFLKISAVAACAALLAACGGDGDDGASTDSGEGVSFSFAMGSSGAQGAFYMEAVERVNKDHGYNGEWVELTGSEVAVEGIASNKFQFGAGVAATAMAAQQEQGAEVTFIGDFMRLIWTLTSKSDMETCDDLDGARFGLHSPGGVSTALFNAWFDQACDSSVEPEILYIEGSPNRLQGLMADQLDATMLEIDDTLDLDDKFHVMVNYSADMPEIETNTIYANNTFLKEHPEVATDLLAEASQLAAEVNEDPSVLADAIRKHKPELADKADTIANAYVDADVLVEDGAMSKEDLEATIKLYEVAEAIKPGLTFDDIADRQYLDKALSED